VNFFFILITFILLPSIGFSQSDTSRTYANYQFKKKSSGTGLGIGYSTHENNTIVGKLNYSFDKKNQWL
jgi:hypothetical protein